MNNTVKYAVELLAVAATLVSSHNLSAQSAEPIQDATTIQTIDVDRQSYGTTAYSEAPDAVVGAAGNVIGPLKPIFVGKKSSYATGGVALRNRGAGNISISGLVGAPRLTLIYWTVISVGAPVAPSNQIQVERLYPLPAAAPVVLKGAQVGVGPAPCWGPRNAIITVFRAVVPAAISGPGNGSYQITLLKGAQGLMDGSDPWAAAPVLPLWDGASMVMIGNGVGTVSIYDAGLAGKTFAPNPNPFNYILALPVVPPGKRLLLDNIGADGQHVNGASRLAQQSMSDETTTINGFSIAGPGSPYVDSDWNGSSGLPVPELWDDTGHDITMVSQDGQLNLNISIFSALGPADCLTPVVNVVEED
jgi:hypothetical protein